MAITTPDAVPGEVIEAAWGDAVRTDLTNLDNRVNKVVTDTGWQTVAPTTGYSGALEYRRIGNMVTATWNIARTGANLASAAVNPVTIPDATCHPGVIIRGVSRITSPADALAFEMRTGGGLNFTGLTINTSGIILGGASWVVIAT